MDKLPEEWRRIPGFDDRYEVSNLGRVRTFAHSGLIGVGRRRKMPKIRSATVSPSHPYPRLGFKIGDGVQMIHVHALVSRAFLGPLPEGHQVRHLDGDPTNNVITNLSYGTACENAADKRRHGRQPVGESCGRSKLTERQVFDIRRRHAAGGVTFAALAREHSVSEFAISAIVKRKTWKHT